MDQMPIAELDTENAQRLADYAAIFQDLGFCIRCCDRLIQILKDGPQDAVLQRALWTSALVAYARCFATGVRYGLTPEIFSGFEGDPLETHEYYLAMRNKHIAHSVNPFEQIKVGAVLSPPASQRREVEGIETFVMTQLHGSIEEIEQLRLLSRTALEWVALAAKDLNQRVLEEAKSIPTEELYQRSNPRTVVPPGKSAKGRR